MTPTKKSLHTSAPLNQNKAQIFPPTGCIFFFQHRNLFCYVTDSVCQHLLYKGAQTLTGYDIYYFLSHIISALHKVLINAFGDEAFTTLRKAWNLNEYHGLGCSTARENGTRRWESGQSKKSCLCDFSLFFSLIFRTCHGRVVAIPGTQTAATPTTVLQTPETWPVQWWSSGSKLDTQVCLDHRGYCFVVKGFKLH